MNVPANVGSSEALNARMVMLFMLVGDVIVSAIHKAKIHPLE